MQSFSDILVQVFRAIAANKLRSVLTMFGIAWGVGSLLVLVGLGEGFRSGQHKQLSTLGNDIIMMFNGTIPAVANQHTGMRPYQLTSGDEAALKLLGIKGSEDIADAIMRRGPTKEGAEPAQKRQLFFAKASDVGKCVRPGQHRQQRQK